MLTQIQLKELLHYNQDTGVFTRLTKPSSNVNIGDIAGSVMSIGYLEINANKKRYYAHRLAWLYIFGHSPINQIDHINGIKNDNRINNLRLATNAENRQNKISPQKNNTSGFLGVYLDKRSNKWVAEVMTAGKKKHIGSFHSPELASVAYLQAKRKLHSFCTI